MGLENPVANTFSHWRKPAGAMPSDVHQRYSDHIFPGSDGHLSEKKIHEVYDARYPDEIYGLRTSLPRSVLDKILSVSPQIPHDRLALQLNADRYQQTGDLSSFTLNAVSPQRVRIIRSRQEIPLDPQYIPKSALERRAKKIGARVQAVITDLIQQGKKSEDAVREVKELALTNGVVILAPAVPRKMLKPVSRFKPIQPSSLRQVVSSTDEGKGVKSEDSIRVASPFNK